MQDTQDQNAGHPTTGKQNAGHPTTGQDGKMQERKIQDTQQLDTFLQVAASISALKQRHYPIGNLYHLATLPP
jgi:hypothetical protein